MLYDVIRPSLYSVGLDKFCDVNAVFSRQKDGCPMVDTICVHQPCLKKALKTAVAGVTEHKYAVTPLHLDLVTSILIVRLLA